MKSKNWRTRQLSSATQELGYHRAEPPASQPVTVSPGWTQLKAPGPDYATLQAQIEEEHWPVAEIREHIKAVGAKPYGRSRADLAQQLAESFLSREHLQATPQALPEDTREIYLALVVNSYLSRPRESLYVLHAPPRPLQTYYRELEEAGLLIRRPGNFILPNIYAAPLPPLYFSYDWEPTESAARQELATPQRTLIYIQQILGLVRGGDVKLRAQYQYSARSWPLAQVLQGGLPAPASVIELGIQRNFFNPKSNKVPGLKMLPPALSLTEQSISHWRETLSLPQTGVEFFYQLLVAARILRPGSPVAVEPQFAQQFLSLSAGKQLAALLHACLELSAWQVCWPLWREGQVRATWTFSGRYEIGINYREELFSLILALRSSFLHFLAALPQGQWLAVAKVGDVLAGYFSSEYFFDHGHLAFANRQNDQDWFLQLYLRAFLRGPLHWLGFVDLEFNKEGALLNFRLQHLQDLLWRRLDEFPLPEFEWLGESGVQWEAQTETLQLQLPVPPALLSHVQRWAKPRGVGKERLRYQPTAERLHALFEQGVTLDDLVTEWEAASGTTPPTQLRAWWQQWWERYGHVRLYPHQTILVTEDEFAIQELQAALPKFQEAILGMINRRVALLAAKESADVVTEMEKKGYLPKVLGK
ncbi:MAG: hypothetical protein U9Q70_10250 [Chloroflexota bacterium]|nr:hypothetical protein [Chloroflexota bacterium]